MAQARALGSEARAAAEASSREAAALEARGKELAEVPPPSSSALTFVQSTPPCDLWPCIRAVASSWYMCVSCQARSIAEQLAREARVASDRAGRDAEQVLRPAPPSPLRARW